MNYNFMSTAEDVVKERVANMARQNERDAIRTYVQDFIDIIRLINTIHNVIDERQTVIVSPSGNNLKANELADIEIPSMFKALILPRSVRFSLDECPKHPDLIDYDVLGGAEETVDIDVGQIRHLTDVMSAILNRNRMSFATIRIGDVWKDQTLADVLDCSTLEVDHESSEEEEQSERLCRLFGNTNVAARVPVPLHSVEAIVSTFNFTANHNQWGEVFKENYRVETTAGFKQKDNTFKVSKEANNK